MSLETDVKAAKGYIPNTPTKVYEDSAHTELVANIYILYLLVGQ